MGCGAPSGLFACFSAVLRLTRSVIRQAATASFSEHDHPQQGAGHSSPCSSPRRSTRACPRATRQATPIWHSRGRRRSRPRAGAASRSAQATSASRGRVRAHPGDRDRPRRGPRSASPGTAGSRCARVPPPSSTPQPRRASTAPADASGGGYEGPPAYRMGKPRQSPEPHMRTGLRRTMSRACADNGHPIGYRAFRLAVSPAPIAHAASRSSARASVRCRLTLV
jgi:hypothetical protein